MKRKLLLLLAASFVFWMNVSAVNIIITQSIQSTGYYNGSDTLWRNDARSLGYNATIDPLSVLNDTTFFAGTDVLVLSESSTHLTPAQIQNIVTFVKRGKSAYIQSEYLDTFSGNVTFQTIMDSAGASFRWVGTVAGQLVPMIILAPFSTTPYPTASISYYWYGCNGTGCGVDSFLDYDNQYFGFYYHQTNTTYGRVITQSDQDWVWGDYDSLLMKNILYHLVEVDSSNNSNTPVNVFPASPSICSGGSVLLVASGANVYAWSPATGLSATTGDSVIAAPTVTTTYTITGNGYCGGSREVIVTVASSLPLTIVPPSVLFCNGLSATLKVTSEGSDFVWSPSGGLSATVGDSVIASPMVSVTYTVTGTDSIGCTVSGSVAVSIIPSPGVPSFTQTGDTLKSSSKHDNQWYYNGYLLNKDTSQYLIIDTPGWYYVIVTNEVNGCSTASDSAYLTLTGINRLIGESGELTVYPNPTSNQLTVENGQVTVNGITITNLLGQEVYKSPSGDLGVKGDFKKQTIDVSGLHDGLYFITVNTDTGILTEKFIVNR